MIKVGFIISLISLVHALVFGQINQKTTFGNLCALGLSVLHEDNSIFVTGRVCQPYQSSAVIRSIFAEYDENGNLIFLDQNIGDSLQSYRSMKILSNREKSKFLIGEYSFDSTANELQLGIFIHKRDSNNQVVWTKEYFDTLDYVYLIVQDAAILENELIAVTGAYVLKGDSIQPGNPSFEDSDIFLMLFDSSGDYISTYRYGNNQSQDEGYSIINDGPNSILIGGDKQFPGGSLYSWVLQCDYSGQILNEYLSSSNNIIGAQELIRTKDGGIAYISSKFDGGFGYKIYAQKIDSFFNLQWTYESNAPFSSETYGYTIDELSSGDLIIGGEKYGNLFEPDTNGYYGFLQRLSLSNGDSTWERSYGLLNNGILNEFDAFFDTHIDDDKIYAIGEVTNPFSPNPPQQELWLVSVDTNGCPHPTCIVGLEEIREFENLKVYPNPTSNNLNVQIDTYNEDLLFSLYDIQGSLQFQQILKSDISTISLSKVPKGLYIFEIRNGKQMDRGKILKE
ncbi:T9SS type A sorting domain-containing protein [Hyphobacterium sp. CCMP332]|nr:T9SS type A sorting domain-containing protein [Hyphobacterium sp. CCMP332]